MAGQTDEAHAAVASAPPPPFPARRPAQIASISSMPRRSHLPEVEAIGREPAQGIVEQAQRPVARAPVRLRRQEDGVARGPSAGGAERLAVVVLTLLIRGRGVAVADAEAQRFEGSRHGFLRPTGGAQGCRRPAERHRQHAGARASEIARGCALAPYARSSRRKRTRSNASSVDRTMRRR
jgi:hypothetical protein